MRIEPLRIGDLVARIPIVQGGMGVGVSLSGLASAVANCGGVGVISGVETGFYREDYAVDKTTANTAGLIEQLRLARQRSPHGIIGVNIMVALRRFADMVKAAVAGGADIIFAGAGLPLDLPQLVAGSRTKIAPIVSSGRAASLICRHWQAKHGRLPDAVVLEGPLAGGHLGYSEEQLHDPESPTLEQLIPEVVAALAPYAGPEGPIPVIAGGGLWDGADVARVLRAGASGAQIASRFVVTEECDASEAFKQEYLRARPEDIVLIKSPVGMPGRAVRNRFLTEVEAGQTRPSRCAYGCLKPCRPTQVPYCIADALISAQRGQLENGFAFIGANGWRAEAIVPVREVFDRLVREIEQA